MNTSNYRGTILKVIFKLFAALFLIGLWICIALYCIEEATDDDEVYFRLKLNFMYVNSSRHF